MACDVSLNDFINLTGVDGAKVLWPHLPPSRNKRNWHYQECMIAAFKLKKICMPLYRVSELDSGGGQIVTHYELNDFINQYRGVAIDETHAVAFEKGIIYDSKNLIYRYNEEKIYQIIIPVFDLI